MPRSVITVAVDFHLISEMNASCSPSPEEIYEQAEEIADEEYRDVDDVYTELTEEQ